MQAQATDLRAFTASRIQLLGNITDPPVMLVSLPLRILPDAFFRRGGCIDFGVEALGVVRIGACEALTPLRRTALHGWLELFDPK